MANQSLVPMAAVQDELCNWEFINQSDFELDDDSDYDLEIIDLVKSLDSSEDDLEQEDPTTDLQARDDDTVMGSPPTNTFDGVNCARVLDLGHHFDVSHDNFSNYATDLHYDCSNGHVYHGDRDRLVHHDDNIDDIDEGESDDAGYDVDDELVPWSVKDRFERQRMRKLGKRAFAKMTKSKKSALIYTRPGCVRGKHGLGLKAY